MVDLDLVYCKMCNAPIIWLPNIMPQCGMCLYINNTNEAHQSLNNSKYWVNQRRKEKINTIISKITY